MAGYVSSLQQPDGSFFGDEWGEVDTRFSYCALSSMAILGQLDSGKIDVKKAGEFVGRQAKQALEEPQDDSTCCTFWLHGTIH